jgi:ankyrin repeat protein
VNAPVVHVTTKGSPETALHWAASRDDVDVLDALLAGGADVEAPGAEFTGGAPMSDAVEFAQWRAARRLLESGATTTLWQAAALGLAERVRDLCADESLAPRELTNALWHGCRGGQQLVAGYLLDRGADLNWTGYDGKTPCDVALESGNDNLVQWLRARGARYAAELV